MELFEIVVLVSCAFKTLYKINIIPGNWRAIFFIHFRQKTNRSGGKFTFSVAGPRPTHRASAALLRKSTAAISANFCQPGPRLRVIALQHRPLFFRGLFVQFML